MFSWRFLKVWSSSLTYSVESRSHGIFCGHCLMSKFRLPNERGVNVICLCWFSKLWCRSGDVDDEIEVFLWRCGFIPSSKFWLANVGIGDLKVVVSFVELMPISIYQPLMSERSENIVKSGRKGLDHQDYF